MRRITNPDIIALIEAQTEGLFSATDFVPVPCCSPTGNRGRAAHSCLALSGWV
jgi:hypothetical protein